MRTVSKPDAKQLPHLETFTKAAELCSFTKAAKALRLSQAAVSQRVQALESALETPLFQRYGGRVTLTDAGRTLYDYAQRILDLHREARQHVAGHEDPVGGDLLLGASSIPAEHLLPALLSAFTQKYPNVRVRAIVGDSEAVMAQVEHGEVGVGLVGRRIDGPHLEYRHLASDRIVLVVPPGHALGRRKKVTLDQLASQPLVLREVGSGLRYSFEKAL